MNASYLHICTNNTIYGTRWSMVPEHPVLFADMSSEFMARVVDVKKFALIYGGAQKNLGPSGVCMSIVRKAKTGAYSLGFLRDVTPLQTVSFVDDAGLGRIEPLPPTHESRFSTTRPCATHCAASRQRSIHSSAATNWPRPSTARAATWPSTGTPTTEASAA